MGLKKNVLLFIVVLLLVIMIILKQNRNESSFFDKWNPDLSMAENYAIYYGISYEEALHLVEIENVAGFLRARLFADLKDTFAGSWVERTPDFKIVVLLTSGDQEALTPYLKEERFAIMRDFIEVQSSAKYTFAELDATQIQVKKSLDSLGIDSYSYIDETKNTIEVCVLDCRPVYKAAKKGDLLLPESVTLSKVNSLGESMPEK